jgi:hypothetical protein
LARAKNTSRAEARRRTRDTIRAEHADLDETSEIEDEPTPQPERKPLFKLPDVRADARALPGIFRSRRLLWLPLLLLLVGFALTLWLETLPPEIGSLATLYVQFFFIPPALFTFFIAGFVAPRASYLVGLIYGAIAGALWSAIILYSTSSLAPDGAATPAGNNDPAFVVGNLLLLGVVYGTLAAAFAAWYRDFLRGMQERGKQRRAEQEAKDRDRRRTERQEARKTAKRTA